MRESVNPFRLVIDISFGLSSFRDAFMKRITFPILALSAILLAACESNIVDNSIQDLTVETPGARNAICYIYVDGFKYKFYPPQTRTVSKSYKPMEIDCKAPGNRDRKVVIEPMINNVTVGAVTMGDIPAALSKVTGNAYYSYPERVEVSFVGAEPKPFPMPAQNAPDIKQPEEYRLEEFLPSVPRLNSDADAQPVVIKRRQHGIDNSGFAPSSSGMDGFGGAMDADPLPPIEPPPAPSSLTQPPRTEAVPAAKADVMQSVSDIGVDMDPGANLNQ